MKPEKLIITSVVRGRKQVQFWESASPIGFGHPIRWVLERTADGVRVRTLKGKTDVLQFDQSIIGGVDMISLPGSEIKLQLRRAHSIRAAYLADRSPRKGNELPLLMAFTGIRRAVVGSAQIHSAYIASRKGKPVFTVQNTPDGIKLTLLASKVHLKKPGRPSFTGSPGEIWKLSREDLASSTVTHGWHWWRFKLIQPEALAQELAAIEEQDDFARNTFWLTAALLALFFVSTFLPHPKAPPVLKEIAIQPPKAGEKIVVFRNPNLPRTNEVGLPVPNARPAEHPSVAKQPHATQKNVAAAVLHPHPQTKPKVAGGRTGEKSREARVAEAQARLLKDALGGVVRDASKITSTDAGATQVSGIFTGKGPVVSETQVRPGFSGTDVKVGSIGGRGAGKAGSESGDGIGYASGEHGTVSGQGSSFVSAGIGGSFVDQGLSKAEVGAVIHEHMDEIRYCHESAMLATPGIQGRLVVDFSIAPSGAVESSSVQSSTLLPDTSIQTCLLKRLTTWRFPKPHGGVHVSVSYPFVFKTLSRDD